MKLRSCAGPRNWADKTAHHLERRETQTSSNLRTVSVRWYIRTAEQTKSTRLRTIELLPASCTHSSHSRITATALSLKAAFNAFGKDLSSSAPRWGPPADKKSRTWESSGEGAHETTASRPAHHQCHRWQWGKGLHQSAATTVFIPAWPNPMVPIPMPEHSSTKFHRSSLQRWWHKTSSMLSARKASWGCFSRTVALKTVRLWHCCGTWRLPTNFTLVPQGQRLAKKASCVARITSATTSVRPHNETIANHNRSKTNHSQLARTAPPLVGHVSQSYLKISEVMILKQWPKSVIPLGLRFWSIPPYLDIRNSVAQRQLHSKWLKDQGILATGSSSKRAFSFLSSSMAFTSEKCPPRNFEPLAGRKLKLQYHQHPPFRASVILIFLKLTTAKTSLPQDPHHCKWEEANVRHNKTI